MSSVENQATEVKRPAFAVLKNPDFRLFFIGACTSFVGSWVESVALSLLVYHQTHSTVALGIVGFAGGIPVTLLMLFGGGIADRVNKRNLILVTQALFGIKSFVLAWLTWTNQIQLIHIAICALIQGVIFAVDGPARQSMIYDIVGKEDLPAGVALQSASFNIARIIGPVIATILYTAFGAGMCFFVNGVSFGAIMLAILFIKTDLTKKGEATGSIWVGFVEGIRYLFSNQVMRSVVGLTAISSVCAFSMYATLMPALATEILGIPEGDRRYGWLFSAIGVGALFGAYLVGKCAATKVRGKLMVSGAVFFALALIGISRTTSVWLAIALFFIVGLAAIAQLATANTLTQSLAPDHLRGRAVSAHMFAMAGLQPIGSYIAGFSAKHWGVANSLAIGGLVFLVYTLGVLVLRPRVASLE